MNFRNISAWSIRNPVVPLVLFIGLTLAGLVSFMGMKVQSQPDIEFPMVIVTISEPGAAPTEIENQITQRIESGVRSIAGVDTITSTASEGNSQTLVMFKIGTDINSAVNEVKNAVDQVRGDLPDGILEPQVIKAETSSDPIGYFAVTANDMTIEQMSWFIDDTVAKRLLAIPGMAEVHRSGGVDREIAVTLDPARMQALGVTASQVNATLRSVNINAAGGRAEVAGSRQAVRVLGNARNAYDLSQTDIALTGGRTVKLADVADVSDSYGELTSIAKFNGKPVVAFSIARARGESDVSVYDTAIKEMNALAKEQGGRVAFHPLFNRVDETKAQYESSMSAMVEGAVLAVIVVFFFLRDWRATMVSAIAIPLSSIPTFWVMNLMGFTLNTMSLLALGLVAGVLVDDAIVEIENIVRHMRMGKSAYQASIDAADEIGLAVVATTFSIVAVFLPVGLMPGVSGQFFKNFGLTVVVAVLFSLAVARMITPMIAAYFLKAKGHAEHGEGPMMDRYMRVLRWSLDTASAWAYRARVADPRGRLSLRQRLAARLRDHRLWMLGIGLLALMLTVVMTMVIPQQFFPDEDSDFVSVNIELVPGTTLQQSEKIVDQVYEVIAAQPEVAVAFERVRETSDNIYINLKKDRARTSIEFVRQLTPVLQRIPDARVTFQDNNGGGPGGGSGRPISVMLSGSDPAKLQSTAQTLIEQMGSLKTLVAPRISADMRRPELVITPRTDLAASLGVTTQALSQTIRIATQGEIDQNSAKFSLSNRQVPIRVKLPVDSRRDLTTIANLPVPIASGGSVPLSRVADIGFGSGPTTIQRYNQSRRIFVGADLASGVAKGTADAQIKALPIMKALPDGVSNAPAGQDRFQQEMLVNFAIALAAGVMLVFSVLVLLYRRLISPLVNMGSLFLAPLGGLLLLGVAGQPMSMPVFIGMLMLFGIVAKNSILLIDFAIEEMGTGRDKLESITDAGHKRAQPIVMTTVAMIAGMIPTAVSIGTNSGWRAPMGTVVIGGLALSTMLTLLIVPAGFSLADGLEKRLGPWLGRKVLNYDPRLSTAEEAGRVTEPMPGEAVPAE
ncbi:efflux RND transporter permease subunit [Novosphingobium lentum]|uniref:efflux RND transporter permease subunit n=1 Tax=Novosphingobium lentum TaxID=145287 RepID=UPI0008361CCB|nr:efflux RND transporter permease subunit [Novosphingobium lentum]